MRYLKFLKLQINFSNGIIYIKNNDEKGMHWLFLTIPDFTTLFTDNYSKLILQDPSGNDFGIFWINYNYTQSTAIYLLGQKIKDSMGIPIFLPYNWTLTYISNSTVSGSATLNFVVIAFDNLEELIDYAFGNAK